MNESDIILFHLLLVIGTLLREQQPIIESTAAMREGLFCAIIANCKMKEGRSRRDGQGWPVRQLAITDECMKSSPYTGVRNYYKIN
jgi:hypothetical protein